MYNENNKQYAEEIKRQIKVREALRDQVEEKIRASKEELKRLEEIDKQDRLLDLHRKYGDDGYPDGAVLTFRYRFHKNDWSSDPCTWYRDQATAQRTGKCNNTAHLSMEYHYAMIKCKDVWYSTGPKAPKAYTWNEMCEWWERGIVSSLRRVTHTATII